MLSNIIIETPIKILSILVIILLMIRLFYRIFTRKFSDSLRCLLGKTAIITGGNDGIGFAIASLLASRGCKVIIADIVNSEFTTNKIKKLTNNENIFTKYLDLSSFASIRKFADEIAKSEDKIDILINNAGVNGTELHEKKDKLNNAMQINYLGPFLLTHLLLDPLKKAEGARILFVGSIFAFINDLSVENLNGINIPRRNTSAATIYGNSKFCNILAAQEFGERLKKYNITANAADPWLIGTKILDLRKEFKWFTLLKRLFLYFLAMDRWTGAQTAFHLACSEKLEGKTGGSYFLCRKWLKPRKLRDPEFCSNIWDKSEELVKLRPEERI